MMDMTTDEIAQRGRPYLIKLIDGHGCVWRVVRSPVLRDALREIGPVPDGWMLVIDRVQVVGRGDRVTLAEYRAALKRSSSEESV